MSTEAELDRFREDTRAWLEENCPASMRTPIDLMKEATWGGRRFPEFAAPAADSKLWMERMAERGWTAPTWPREYGGGGLTREENQVLQAELRGITARNQDAAVGVLAI